MTAIRQRARGEEQKAERRRQILDAAEVRFETRTFAEVSLADIAADVGVTKAALYRYFASKESLFIGLFDRAFAHLHEAATTVDAASKADALATIVLSSRLYCRLSAIMNTVLEANLDEETARAFKKSVVANLEQLAGLLVERGVLDARNAVSDLLRVQEALVGCWHMSHRSPIVASLVREPEFQLLATDFEISLRAHIAALFGPRP
ncbi:MAG: TetR/AcrR family transcriptional regulator [Hyphomicrobiales bacterium]|nr:MAG: TetR/AcrR family transcriptional regulator [Hyphomicrobiales bacterium]